MLFKPLTLNSSLLLLVYTVFFMITTSIPILLVENFKFFCFTSIIVRTIVAMSHCLFHLHQHTHYWDCWLMVLLYSTYNKWHLFHPVIVVHALLIGHPVFGCMCPGLSNKKKRNLLKNSQAVKKWCGLISINIIAAILGRHLWFPNLFHPGRNAYIQGYSMGMLKGVYFSKFYQISNLDISLQLSQAFKAAPLFHSLLFFE